MSGSSSLLVNLLLSPATKSAFPSNLAPEGKVGKEAVMFGLERKASMLRRQRGGGG